jgi:transcriptional regulator with XRE-family HTH domain
MQQYEQQKQELGKRIQQGRKQLSLNVAQFAAQVGVSAQAVAQWELGEAQPRGKNLAKLSDVLKTTPEYIQFGYSSEEESIKALDQLLNTPDYKLATQKAFKQTVSQGADIGWVVVPEGEDDNIKPLGDIMAANLRREYTKLMHKQNQSG